MHKHSNYLRRSAPCTTLTVPPYSKCIDLLSADV
jgi:hypothetical protein